MMVRETSNIVLLEDLENAIETIDIEYFDGKTVLITGATGLVGSSLVRLLLCCNRVKGTRIDVVALVRNENKAIDIFGDVLCREDLKLVNQDLTKSIDIDIKTDIIIHCASVTASKQMVNEPVETIKASLIGTMNMLDYAVDVGSTDFIYVSSMEMYGNITDTIEATEERIGYIDVLNVRSNYPECKRMCENMSIAYASEYGINVKIVRLAQVFGAGILKNENRVFAQFARSVIAGEDIVLHTKGTSEGNYCYLSDALCGILTVCSKGNNKEAYNVVNEESHTTIAEMANMVANEIGNGKISVVFDIPDCNVHGYAADTKLKLSSEKLRKLGWYAKYNLKQSYERMIDGMIG